MRPACKRSYLFLRFVSQVLASMLCDGELRTREELNHFSLYFVVVVLKIKKISSSDIVQFFNPPSVGCEILSNECASDALCCMKFETSHRVIMRQQRLKACRQGCAVIPEICLFYQQEF